MKNISRKNDDEKVNDTKSNISQNESHQPLNSDLQQSINFRILNASRGNLSQKGQKPEQPPHQGKNGSQKQANNSLQKRIPSNKEYKEDEKINSSYSNQNSNNNS